MFGVLSIMFQLDHFFPLVFLKNPYICTFFSFAPDGPSVLHFLNAKCKQEWLEAHTNISGATQSLGSHVFGIFIPAASTLCLQMAMTNCLS